MNDLSEEAKIGRPSKFTAKVKEAILEAVGKGVSLAFACEYAGINKRTLFLWLQRGLKADESGEDAEYYAFCTAVKRAKAYAVVEAVTYIRGHGEKWQADAWWLERRYPEEFGQNIAVRVQGGLDALVMAGQGDGEEKPAESAIDVTATPEQLVDRYKGAILAVFAEAGAEIAPEGGDGNGRGGNRRGGNGHESDSDGHKGSDGSDLQKPIYPV